MEEEHTDQTRQQIFKTTYRRKIDLRRMTAVCQGDRELARSLVVNALREIADDIENGKWDRHPVKTHIQIAIYKVGWLFSVYTGHPQWNLKMFTRTSL